MTLLFTGDVDAMAFILDEALIMIPVLYIIGSIIKYTTSLLNKWIPLILLLFSIAYTPILLGGYSADNIIQAILIAGVTVFGNQLIKQIGKGDDRNGKQTRKHNTKS